MHKVTKVYEAALLPHWCVLFIHAWSTLEVLWSRRFICVCTMWSETAAQWEADSHSTAASCWCPSFALPSNHWLLHKQQCWLIALLTASWNACVLCLSSPCACMSHANGHLQITAACTDIALHALFSMTHWNTSLYTSVFQPFCCCGTLHKREGHSRNPMQWFVSPAEYRPTGEVEVSGCLEAENLWGSESKTQKADDN